MGSYTNHNISLIRQNINPVLNGEAMAIGYPSYASLFYPYLVDNGGNTSSPTMVIDTVNNPNDVLGVSFVVKQTTNPYHQAHLGNAYLFNNQQITAYIARSTQLQDPRNSVYTNTRITITLTNIITGLSVVVKEFTNLAVPKDDSSRYFTIDLPSLNNSVFSLYGLYGACVLSLDTDIELYGDRRFKTKLGVIEGHHYRLQMLIYSAASEAFNVSSTIPIFDESIVGSENYDALFEKSLMGNYNGVRSVALNSSQKRAVVCDQMAVLFMSQHPVLTCDIAPSPVLGLGCTTTHDTTYSSQNGVYTQKYKNVDMVLDRRFGLPIGYTTFGYSKEIEKYFSDYNLSHQTLRDPCRILCMNTGGQLNNGFGVDGIIFNPYVVKHVNADLCYPQTLQYNFVLSNSTNSLMEIRLSDVSGSPIVNSTSNVSVYFSCSMPLQQVQYTIWTHNSLGWQTFVDYDATTTRHNFNLGMNGIIVTRDSAGNLLRGDVATVQIKYIDWHGVSGVFSQEFFVPEIHADPAIVDIVAYQIPDGNGTIQLVYKYDGGSEVNNTMVNLYYSLDNIRWTQVTAGVSGDVGMITPGLRRIQWFAGDVLPVGTKKVLLRLASANPAVGVVDVDGYTDKGIWAARSKTVSVEFAQPITVLRRLSEYEIQQIELENNSSLSIFSSNSSLSSASLSSNPMSNSSLSTSSWSRSESSVSVSQSSISMSISSRSSRSSHSSYSSLTTVTPATGGIITRVGGEYVHTFTDNGLFSVNVGSLSCKCLVVAGGGGGGGGGNRGQGGGGAGGVLYAPALSVTTGAHSVLVGGGGGTNNDGAASIFLTLTAAGGGGGGYAGSPAGKTGGSGGGGDSYPGIGAHSGGSGTGGQGSSGGSSIASYNLGFMAGGGGGGAGGIGGNASGPGTTGTTNTPGDGGAGVYNSISGVSVAYGGGGGGSGSTSYGSDLAGNGGLGGGGAAASGYGQNGQDGVAHTGAGGGGGGNGDGGTGGNGGSGGSGIVIIRYAYP